jgi:hypothetical protein
MFSAYALSLGFAPIILQDSSSTDKGSQVFCPICVANGYASGMRTRKDWFISANSSGGALWFTGISRLQLGATYHQASKGLRGLLGYQVIQESQSSPALNLSYGIQSQETGRTGTSLTFEKNYTRGSTQSMNVFAGVSFRSNESNGRVVGGLKYSSDDRWFYGNQFDGEDHNPFLQYVRGNQSVGLIYIGAKNLSLTVGYSF